MEHVQRGDRYYQADAMDGIELDLLGHWAEQKEWLDRPGWGAKLSDGHRALLRRAIAIVIATPSSPIAIPADGWVTRAWVCESEEDLAALVATLRAQGFVARDESTNAGDARFEAHHLDRRELLAYMKSLKVA
jgi:hypothetical protein